MLDGPTVASPHPYYSTIDPIPQADLNQIPYHCSKTPSEEKIRSVTRIPQVVSTTL